MISIASATVAGSGATSPCRRIPGTLEITYIDAQDPLRQFMELAQASDGTLV